MSEQEKNIVQLLAFAYLQNARPEKAAVLLAALDAVAPGQRKVLRALALAQLRCGQPQSALDTLERVALCGGIDAAFHLLRARALIACERRLEAAAAVASCLAMRRARPAGEARP
jgi:Flp pilus assembly protein TadD